jgi:hypothetical protein
MRPVGVQRTNLPGGLRINPRTNTVVTPKSGVKTNAVAGKQATNAIAGKPAATAKTASPFLEARRRWQSNAAFYPAVGIIVCLIGLLVYRLFQAKSQKASQALVPTPSSKLTSKVARRQAGAPIHACNVLEVGAEARQVWQFDARGGRYSLNREQTCLEGEALPAGMVAKDWRSLVQRKLNIAWLPPESVFLRVIQLPRSDFNETLAMVELQLEKVSPMPVAQVVWSLQILPHTQGNLQTVIVLIVSRSLVEEFLGKLESQGYLADRLELPLLDQLQTTAITEDGAWIYPEAAGGKDTALVAWWYGGVLRNLDLLTLAANNPASLKEQLMQMAWAGEMDGWLTAPPAWHLVADVGAGEWETALRAGLEQPVELITPTPARELAALTARRSAQAEPRANLMPEEFIIRYQQQFVDRLWMRGLVGVGGIYLVGVAIYMGLVAFANYQTGTKEDEVARLGPTYTNAIQLSAKLQVLRDRNELKFAALECWNATAKLLPENVTLENMSFNQGKRLHLDGTAPADQYNTLINFEKAMRQYSKEGKPLFIANTDDTLTFHPNGPNATWALNLDLKRGEVE